MSTIADCVELASFAQQLDNAEHMLKRADEYNDKLAVHIDNLKNVVRSNQNILEKLQANEQHMKALFEDQSQSELHAQMITDVKRLKKKLFVTLTTFDRLEAEQKASADNRDHSSTLAQEICELGANLVSIGNELMLLREDKAAAKRALYQLQQWSCRGPNIADTCWTHCMAPLQENTLPVDQLAVLRKATESLSLAFNKSTESTREVKCQKHIIERVEQVLAIAERLNIKSEKLLNVKILSKMVLKALIKRKQLYQLCSDNKLPNERVSNITFEQVCQKTTHANFSCNPYIE
ncbi:uncharacterized protein [Drosophila virilis]|uniref:Uncharacterized protein, isoform A n=1 Tax=Drosophila virilis TaxID=7244 RepID=B4M6H1_DROVI|nr:uncharacterized protein LOC6633014 isoform X2 [Drosophila virilis]EDW59247.2 uncharacterized protein Dvir_GJ10390, isoform A [Drosophila virilis]